MGYIYKITNDINEKIYVGKTEFVNPEDRWKEHLHDYKKIKNEKRPLYLAMNKYGEEHFHFEVIEETDDPEKTCEREKYWIEKLRTYVGFKDCNGYNATLGGDGKSYLNLNEDEVIKYHTEEAYYIVGRTAQYFGVDPITVKKILIKNNIRILTSNEFNKIFGTKSVCQLDAKTNKLLKVFKSYADANEYMGKDRHSSVIRMASYGKIKTAYGFKWMKYEDYLKINNCDIKEELVS